MSYLYSERINPKVPPNPKEPSLVDGSCAFVRSADHLTVVRVLKEKISHMDSNTLHGPNAIQVLIPMNTHG